MIGQLRTRDIVPVDLNSILAFCENTLAQFHLLLGKNKVQTFFLKFYNTRSFYQNLSLYFIQTSPILYITGNDTKSAAYNASYQARVEAMEQVFWSETDGAYYDYIISTRQHHKYISIAVMYKCCNTRFLS